MPRSKKSSSLLTTNAATTSLPDDSIKAVRMTLTFFPWDIERIQKAEAFVRAAGGKGETALTVRTLLPHAPLDENFLARYEELYNHDPRRRRFTR